MGERRVGIAMDFSSSSKNALRWGLKNIVRDYDHVIIIIVTKKQNEIGEMHLWQDIGSPLIPLSDFAQPIFSQKYGIANDAELFSLLDEERRRLKLTVVFKVYWGDAREKICDAVAELPLDCLVMGNRGLGTVQSVSNYVVNNAPCPVTVVKLLEDSDHPSSY